MTDSRATASPNADDKETTSLDSDRQFGLWSYCTFMPAIGIALPVAATYGLFRLVSSETGGLIGTTLLNGVQWLAGWIDPSLAALPLCE